MSKEIERKFLVTSTAYRLLAERKIDMRQAYLSLRPEATVRVRITGDKAKLTIKGITVGATRDEWEYPIPLSDAMDMIDTCSQGTIIDKTRFIVGQWEIDEFHGTLDGLTVAEIELADEKQQFDIPEFLGKEVTGDIRYYNASLATATSIPTD